MTRGRYTRERKRKVEDLLELAYYAFGGKCYHRMRDPSTLVVDHGVPSGSTTVCGHRMWYVADDPQRTWRGAPEWAVHHEYEPCKVCYGRHYKYVRQETS